MKQTGEHGGRHRPLAALLRSTALAKTILAAAALVALRGSNARAQDAASSDPDGKLAVAERLAALAKQDLRAWPAEPPAAGWREASSLLRAAERLSPDEPRFARFAAEASLHLGDRAAAVAAVKEYRRVAPDDAAAQLRLIDLYLAGMETADQKLNYLAQVAGQQAVPATVRAAVAVRRSVLLADRSQKSESLKALDLALQLDPLNIAALRAKYDRTVSDASTLQRVGLLLAMIRSNPRQPAVASRLAGELADLGLVRDALDWYTLANNLYAAEGARPDASFARGAATAMLENGQADGAVKLLQQYLTVSPGDADGWFTLVAAARSASAAAGDEPSKAVVEQVARQAGNAMVNRLIVAQSLAAAAQKGGASSQPAEGPTTRPLDADPAPPPDVTADADLVRRAGDRRVINGYIAAAQDLAWFDVYVRRDAAAAGPLIDVLTKILPAGDPVLLRLQGWAKYVGGDAVGAKPKLAAAAGRDPMAALGLILIGHADPATQDQAVGDANKLLSQHPSGTVGATLYEALSPLNARVAPGKDADAASAQLGSFPRDWVDVLSRPQDFYVLRGEPLRISHEYGQPVLAKVTIQNVSRYDLAVGDDGTVRPDVWIDAAAPGALERPVAAVETARLEGRLVLPAGQSVSQIVRLDDESLSSLLRAAPERPLTLTFKAVSNPLGVGRLSDGSPAPDTQPGPCGYAVQFAHLVERESTPLSTPRDLQSLRDAVSDGPGDQKVRTIDLMAVLAAAAPSGGSSLSPEAKAAGEQMRRNVRAAAAASISGPPRAWAAVTAASLASPDERAAAVRQMAGDDDWLTRLLAVRMARSDSDRGKAVAAMLANDKDELVKAYAGAVASEPATPATGPSTAPTAGADEAGK